jgi:hypothetical protein
VELFSACISACGVSITSSAKKQHDSDVNVSKVLVFVLRRRRFQGLQEGGRGGNDVSLHRMEDRRHTKRRDLKRDVKSGVTGFPAWPRLQLIATPCRGPAPTGEHLDVDDK